MYTKTTIVAGILILIGFFDAAAQNSTVQTPKDPTVAGSSNASAAEPGIGKFYVRAYGGYGLLTPGSYKTYVLASTASGESFSTVRPGLGGGFHFGGGAGYIINDFLNVGVDADYLNGKNLVRTISAPDYATSSTLAHSVFSLIPNITFKAISKPNYFIYNRLGIILAISTKLSQSGFDSSSAANDVYGSTTNIDYMFGLNVGVQSALGAQFKLIGNFRGFAEIV